MSEPTEGPWSFEALNEIMAGEPDYGMMVVGADGETIVAQCVAERDLPLVSSAWLMFKALHVAERALINAEQTLDIKAAHLAVARAIAQATAQSPRHDSDRA